MNMKQLWFDLLKEWRLTIFNDKEIVYTELIDEHRANSIMQALTKSAMIVIEGFWNVNRQDVQVRRIEKEMKKVNVEENKYKDEINKNITIRKRLSQWLKDNPSKYETLRLEILEQFEWKEWFIQISDLARETLILSSCRILAKKKWLIIF